MQREMMRIMKTDAERHLLNQLYALFALDMDTISASNLDSNLNSELQSIQKELIAAKPHHNASTQQTTLHQLQDLSDEEGFDFGRQAQPGEETGIDSDAYVASYHEWDFRLADYLPDYVRVVDRNIKGIDNDFYADTLKHYHGLVQRTRRAFELLRPDGLCMKRQWYAHGRCYSPCR